MYNLPNAATSENNIALVQNFIRKIEEPFELAISEMSLTVRKVYLATRRLRHLPEEVPDPQPALPEAVLPANREAGAAATPDIGFQRGPAALQSELPGHPDFQRKRPLHPLALPKKDLRPT